MTFYVGQKVVCIREFMSPRKTGEVYPIGG